MNDGQLGLIQRAAARLRQQEPGKAFVPPAAAPTAAIGLSGAAASAEGLAGAARNTREVTIDLRRLAKAGVSLPAAERSRTAEEFRIVKRHLLANVQHQQPVDETGWSARIIMVTSARPREGKTFTTVNLSLAIASERDYRVLVLDGDSERQGLAEMFGIESDTGIVDLLTGDKVDVADVLVRTNIPNLTVLPCGRARPGTPELFSSRKMRDLLHDLAQRYNDRLIIIDAPPCLATSHASILASLVGQIVFVVEANRTQSPEIEESLRLISGCPNIGLLLNKTEWSSSEQFGSYGYH